MNNKFKYTNRKKAVAKLCIDRLQYQHNSSARGKDDLGGRFGGSDSMPISVAHEEHPCRGKRPDLGGLLLYGAAERGNPHSSCIHMDYMYNKLYNHASQAHTLLRPHDSVGGIVKVMMIDESSYYHGCRLHTIQFMLDDKVTIFRNDS